MTEATTFSELLEQETQNWIREEINKGNDAWNARRPIDGLSNVHWDLVAQSALQLKKHLSDPAQNMTPGIFLCRCIQAHRPELLRKSDGTLAETSDLIHCKPETLKPWPTDTIRVIVRNLERLCLEELGCENPGTAWNSIFKRDISHRRMGDRQEAYHVAFLLNMTVEEMQHYFFLTRQEGFSLRDPLDIVCFTYKLFDKGKAHADSFRWRDVTDLLQEYLDACEKAAVPTDRSARHPSQKKDSTLHLDRDVQKLYANMHRTQDPALDIPALRRDLKAYLVAHHRNLVEMKIERVSLPQGQSRVDFCMGYPYSYTVQNELSLLVGYLLVLYGCWNEVVQAVYRKKDPKRMNELMLSYEEGSEPKLLSSKDFAEVLSKTLREAFEPLKEALQARLDPDFLREPLPDRLSPQDTILLMGRWLLRVTPRVAEETDDFEPALQRLNDFLLYAKELDRSFAPASTYPVSAQKTSAAVWNIAGRLHCRKALSGLIAAGPGASTNTSGWAGYLHELGLKLTRVAADPSNFNDRTPCGILGPHQHDALQSVLTSLSSYAPYLELYSADGKGLRYKRVQSRLEMSLPNLCGKIQTTMNRYYPTAELHALREEQPRKQKLDGWHLNNALGSNLLSRDDILQLFFFLFLALYDCSAADSDKASETSTMEQRWLDAMRDRAEEQLAGPSHTTGSFLEDALFSSVCVELECLWAAPKSDTVTQDQATILCRCYNFLLDSLSAASGTTWHRIYYPAFTDRFYVLAGALAIAVPESRRTLGFMMGIHRQKKRKPAKKR